MKQDYRLLVLDLDGTLTNSKKEISPRNLRTLLRQDTQIPAETTPPPKTEKKMIKKSRI